MEVGVPGSFGDEFELAEFEDLPSSDQVSLLNSEGECLLVANPSLLAPSTAD